MCLSHVWVTKLNFLIILAGEPTAIQYGGIDLLTTDIVPIIDPLPIVTPGSILTNSPIQTLSSIVTF